MNSKLSLFSFLWIAASLSCHVVIAQSNYKLSFQSASYTFYCGIVDDAFFYLVDASGKNRPIKFQATARGASIEYNENGKVRILPSREDFTIQVYGEMQGKLYWVSDVPAKCKVPPLDNESFKSNHPNPQKELKNPTTFSAAGKEVARSLDIFLSIPGGGIDYLKQGEGNRIALDVTKDENDQLLHHQWGDYELQSEMQKSSTGFPFHQNNQWRFFPTFQPHLLLRGGQLRLYC